MYNYVAIDFETATGYQNSACAVGIVTVESGKIIEEFYSLIQPPDNYYWQQNINIHGIRPNDTLRELTFVELYPQIKQRLESKVIVAHNESFDRNVLLKTMQYYNLNYNELNLPKRWECTVKIYRSKGFTSASLGNCCRIMNIQLNHHEALSDARACAKLYFLHLNEVSTNC
ncbi:MAG: DNA polymerase III subunit epsilon [Bacteroidetes bacterium GWA2_30_7]|nr:MAG: DNA polymerase III subunit epsilon [Bacteroidetes bacterium GWA2_30_7]